jgi:hypothetical protein
VNVREHVLGSDGAKAHPPTMVLVHPVKIVSSSRITTLFISSTSSRGILMNVQVSSCHDIELSVSARKGYDNALALSSYISHGE